jgi:hypothetical protein
LQRNRSSSHKRDTSDTHLGCGMRQTSTYQPKRRQCHLRPQGCCQAVIASSFGKQLQTDEDYHDSQNAGADTFEINPKFSVQLR